MSSMLTVLDKGYVKLLNVAGLGDVETTPATAARVSFDAKEDYTKEKATKLLSYLWKYKHTTPFEMIETWWEMKLPIFVARQLVRHRTVSINEVSRRYVTHDLEFYYPDVWRKASKDKKQGSKGVMSDKRYADSRLIDVIDQAIYSYDKLIDFGVCPEQARIVLPLNTYTRWVWKQDFHNLMHMLNLRCDEHAQWETREYAVAMKQILCDTYPTLMGVVLNDRS